MAARRRPRGAGPALRVHRNGQYVIRIIGRDHYLGSTRKISEEEARRRRFDLLARHANGDLPPVELRQAGDHALTVSDLVDRYVEVFCARHPRYRDESGEPKYHARDVRDQLLQLKGRCASMSAKQFSKSNLVTLRDAMIRERLARSTINRRISRIKELFRWGAEHDLVPESVWTALLPIKGASHGQSRPARKVRCVPEHIVKATLPHLSPHFRVVVELMLLTGARAGEILQMRRGDITRREDGLWELRPSQHKTTWRGQERTIYLTAEAQELLKPWLPLDPGSYVFSPERIGEADRRAKRAARKTPVGPTQRKKEAKMRRNYPPHFASNNLANSIARAIKRAGVPHWHAHQLRHTAASRFEREHGIQVTRVLLGHTSASMTDRYVHPDEQLAIEKLTGSGS